MEKSTRSYESDSPLAPNPDKPIGLVLSGGGARGAFQVGVWEVLQSNPRGIRDLPKVISGTSAGALNGAFIAAGLSPQEMLAFWLDLAEDPPVIGNDNFFKFLQDAIQTLILKEPFRTPYKRIREFRVLRSMFKRHPWYRSSGLMAMMLEFVLTARFDSISEILENIKTSYLLNTEPVRERLARAIGAPTLRGTDVRLAINTVDVRTGQVVRIVNHDPGKRSPASAKHYRVVKEITLDMILASASIPLLFNPVKLDQLTLWDGGVLVNTPLAPAVALGAQRIVPVLVTVRNFEDVDSHEVLPDFGSAVERLANSFLENAYNIDRKLLLERNRLAAADKELKEVELFRAIRPSSGKLFNAGSYLYFERGALLAMYEAGKLATRRWLEKGPERDHSAATEG